MWPRLRISLSKEKQKALQSDVNREYLSAVATKSYGDYFLKLQKTMMNEPSESRLSETLLDPGQEAISSILENSAVFSDDLKSLLLNFFHVSAEASKFCGHLLRNLSQLQSDNTFIHRVIDAVAGDNPVPPSAADDLRSCIVLHNPFPDLHKREFDQFQNQHLAILQTLKSNRRLVARKLRFIKFINQASGVCITAAFGLVAAAAAFIAVHAVAAVVISPAAAALFSIIIPIRTRKKKIGSIIRNVKLISKYGFLRKAADQLDAAAKGAYIVGREFETMRGLVGRLGDEVEHNRELMKACVERRRFPGRVVEELRKYGVGLRKQAEEVEEHLYLCLITINTARALLLREIT